MNQIILQITDTKMNNVFLNIVQNSEKLLKFSKSIKNKNSVDIILEPCLVGKVSYYSGLLFEGYVEGTAYPVLRGGCYDDIIAKYSVYNINATGFAIDMSTFLKVNFS